MRQSLPDTSQKECDNKMSLQIVTTNQSKVEFHMFLLRLYPLWYCVNVYEKFILLWWKLWLCCHIFVAWRVGKCETKLTHHFLSHFDCLCIDFITSTWLNIIRNFCGITPSIGRLFTCCFLDSTCSKSKHSSYNSF